MSLLLLVASTAGCVRNPSEADARKYYAGRKATLDRIETELKAAVEKFPHAGVRYRCPQVAGQPTKNAGLCLHAYVPWIRDSMAKEKAFYTKTSARWLDLEGVKAVNFIISREAPVRPRAMGGFMLAGVARPSKWGTNGGGAWRASRKGAVPPGSGFGVDHRQVGYGQGQLDFHVCAGRRYDGGGKYHPQIDVAWSFRYREVKVDLEVNVLGTGQTPEVWRRARKKTCSRK